MFWLAEQPALKLKVNRQTKLKGAFSSFHACLLIWAEELTSEKLYQAYPV